MVKKVFSLYYCMKIFLLCCMQCSLLLKGQASSSSSRGGNKNPLLPTRVFKDGESSVHTFDNVLGKRLLGTIAQVVKRHLTWQFVHPDAYAGIGRRDNGDLHWCAPMSPKNFAKSLIWRGLKKGLRGTGMLDGRDFYPYDIQGIMLLRGFSPVVYHGNGAGDVYIRLFLTTGLKKNDYSELMLYNAKDEIFASIHPRYGRVAIWNDTLDFIFKPPSMNFEQGEYSLLIKATLDKKKFEENEHHYQEAIRRHNELSNQPFPFLNASSEDIYNINLADHLTYNFTDSKGRIVAVFDNVVPKEELDTLRNFFMNKNSAYSYGTYDPDVGETHDNVNWIVQQKPASSVTDSRIWKYVHHCASFLSGENQWFPYDVAMNIIQHSHHTRIHADCSKTEHEYTFLMYLSPEWHEGRYGETIFVEEMENIPGESEKLGNEKYETLSAVIPKYGRIVIFRNIIDHSARPPSPDFLAARYTFAVKVGRSPEIAIAKTLRELLDIHTDIPKARRLQDEIYAGKYDVFNDPKIEKFLRKNLAQYYAMTVESVKSTKSSLFQMLKLKEL